MTRLRITAGALVVLAAVLLAASPVAGTWKMVATHDGEDSNWTLVIKEDDGGKLTGTLSGEMGDYTLSDVRFENGTFTCKVAIDYDEYTVTAKVSGAKLEGTFKGSGMSGKVSATKQS